MTVLFTLLWIGWFMLFSLCR